MMKTYAHIQLKGTAAEIRFDWLGFDGDDCFGEFNITVTEDGQARQFNFGPCVVHGLRKLTKLFDNPSQTAVSGAFRHPDVRSYKLQRSGNNYRLVVQFEGAGLNEIHEVQTTNIDIDEAFLKAYDG